MAERERRRDATATIREAARDVLEQLGRGSAKIDALADATGYARATVNRALQLIEAAGAPIGKVRERQGIRYSMATGWARPVFMLTRQELLDLAVDREGLEREADAVAAMSLMRASVGYDDQTGRWVAEAPGPVTGVGRDVPEAVEVCYRAWVGAGKPRRPRHRPSLEIVEGVNHG